MRAFWIVTLGIVGCPAAEATDTSPPMATTADDGSTGATATSGNSSDPTGSHPSSSTSGATDLPDETSSTGSGTGDPNPANCGDGIEQIGESCDDGNDVDADGCNADCVPSGEELWTWSYSGGVGENDEGYAIVPGKPGELYVAGYTRPTAGAYAQGWLRHLSVRGDELGAYSLVSVGAGNAAFRDLIFDGEFLYIAGYATTIDHEDVWVSKLNVGDETEWTQTYDGPGAATDSAWGVAYDGAGNVFVTGYHATATEGSDVFLRKYDVAGNLSWSRSHAGPSQGTDAGRGLAVSSTGAIYLVGTLEVAGEAQNGWIARYDQDGNQVWSRMFAGAGNGDDYFQAVGLNAAEEPVVCGYETLAEIPWRSIVRQYDSQGNVVWTEFFDGTSHEGSHCFGMVIDHAGNLVMTGGENVSGVREIMVRKVSGSGSQLWARTVLYDGLTGYGIDVDVDADDRIYISGTFEGDDGRDVFAGLFTP